MTTLSHLSPRFNLEPDYKSDLLSLVIRLLIGFFLISDVSTVSGVVVSIASVCLFLYRICYYLVYMYALSLIWCNNFER